jgi:hypothetical protein
LNTGSNSPSAPHPQFLFPEPGALVEDIAKFFKETLNKQANRGEQNKNRGKWYE